MKKIYQIIMLCALSIAMASCGGGSTTETSNEKEPTDYKEACEQRDFQKAYLIVNEIKKEMQEYENENSHMIHDAWINTDERTTFNNLKKNYEDAEHYVVLQEATYVLESQGLDGLVKIAMIVKEHDAEWLYKDLIDIAVAMGNDELANRMKKLAGYNIEEKNEEK